MLLNKFAGASRAGGVHSLAGVVSAAARLTATDHHHHNLINSRPILHNHLASTIKSSSVSYATESHSIRSISLLANNTSINSLSASIHRREFATWCIKFTRPQPVVVATQLGKYEEHRNILKHQHHPTNLNRTYADSPHGGGSKPEIYTPPPPPPPPPSYAKKHRGKYIALLAAVAICVWAYLDNKRRIAEREERSRPPAPVPIFDIEIPDDDEEEEKQEEEDEYLLLQENSDKIRIAIIGAGIGGCSAAFFLRELLKDKAEITVFEREGKIGGRLRDVDVAGMKAELGASIFLSDKDHKDYFNSLLEIFKDIEVEKANAKTHRLFGIWDGDQFSYIQCRYSIIDKLKILYRYGFAPLTFKRYVTDAINKWYKLYDLQREGETWETVEELFRRLGLYGITQMTLAEYISPSNPQAKATNGVVSERFIRDFVNGVDRANYGQTAANMNAFCGMVSFAPGEFKHVINGNSSMCDRLLKSAEATLLTETPVVTIDVLKKRRKPAESISTPTLDTPKYVLRTKKVKNALQSPDFVDSAETIEARVFDAVVIAAPLSFADIQFSDAINVPASALKKRDYQRTHVTLVATPSINPAYFGKKRARDVPGAILTQDVDKIPFYSIGLVNKDEKQGLRLYKVFSQQELSDEFLDQLFLDRKETVRHVWSSYPIMNPADDWPAINLAPNMYYINAMETPVSCMETEMIASKNVSLLLAKAQGVEVGSPLATTVLEAEELEVTDEELQPEPQPQLLLQEPSLEQVSLGTIEEAAVASQAD